MWSSRKSKSKVKRSITSAESLGAGEDSVEFQGDAQGITWLHRIQNMLAVYMGVNQHLTMV